MAADATTAPRTTPKPRSRLTARVRRDVLVDHAALRLVATRAGRRDPALVDRITGEIDAALELFEERGWTADPASYHETPPPPADVRTRRTRSGNLRYTSMSWDDGYRVRPEEPGAKRFAAYGVNRIARASLLEHRSGDRPWLVCIHGFGMGMPGLDLRAFRAMHLFRDLGLNVAFLTLPFHGRRNPGGPRSAPAMPGVDLVDTLHGMTQAVWDARQLLAHLRSRTDRPVGVMGLSLGGCVSGLVASLDDPDGVILLVPAVDLPTLMSAAAARLGEAVADANELTQRAEALLAPVSPLRLEPRLPTERMAIVAGTLDQFADPTSQAIALWHHWGEPDLHWYHGGHVSLFWTPRVRRAVDDSLTRFGLVAAR